MSFFETSFLWLEAVVASVAVAAALAVVGVYTIQRRVVFLPAALSQISGLGVVLAFGIAVLVPSLEESKLYGPEIVSTVFTLGGALLLGWLPSSRRTSRDVIIGVAFITASAGVIIIGDRIPGEAHDIKNILFGNAVAVTRPQMWVSLVVSGVVLAIHRALRGPFLFVSFDPDTAKAHGLPVRLIDGALFLTMAIAISTATKTIGAMPVFAFAVLPAAAALRFFSSTPLVFFGAAAIGASSAFFGYYASFVWSFPTGASMVAVTAVWFAVSLFSPKRR